MVRWAFTSWLVLAAACGQGEPTAPRTPSGHAARTADARPAVAELTKTEGDVRWQGAAAVSWTGAHTGLGLRPRDAVQTMDRASATVQFRAKGVLAQIGPRTTLRIPDQEPTVAHLSHLSGRLVARLPGGGSVQRLEVDLPPGTLVLGPSAAGATSPDQSVEARVEVDHGRTQIAMLDGAGRLERTHGGAVALQEDHFIEVRNDGEVTNSGRVGAQAELTSPANGATVRTRQETRFSWSRIPGAAAFRLAVRAEGGATRHEDVPADRTEAGLELSSGVYSWTVCGLVDDEEMPRSEARTVTVELDRAPPTLEIGTPAPGATVSGGAVQVAGRAEPGATLTVQGREVEVTASGTFSTSVPVPRGLTNVVVSAADDLGNRRVVSRTVLRE